MVFSFFQCGILQIQIKLEIWKDICFLSIFIAVVAQWIRPQTLNREVPGSNLLASAVVPLGKALYPHA